MSDPHLSEKPEEDDLPKAPHITRPSAAADPPDRWAEDARYEYAVNQGLRDSRPIGPAPKKEE